MRKIPTLFKRDPNDRARVIDEVTPGCEWVLAGEGVATVKMDGACCRVETVDKDDIERSRLWKRREVKPGREIPDGFEPCGEPDPVTGKVVGWVPVGEGPEDEWFREGFDNTLAFDVWPDGTYELVGPKVQGNPYGMTTHTLLGHDVTWHFNKPRDLSFDGIREELTTSWEEGIVWHHPDGRMAKIKRRDFGLPWPVKEER